MYSACLASAGGSGAIGAIFHLDRKGCDLASDAKNDPHPVLKITLFLSVLCVFAPLRWMFLLSHDPNKAAND